jgi:DMSO/TMAO reductase YedYZ heme-binding membrane subunit
MVAFDTKFWWYASRASGVVLWLVLVASVVWGFAVSTRLVRRKGLPAWMLDLHKHLGTLAVVFTVAHLVALWADSFVEFGWRELFVPMASPWRPGAVTWGIIAFYLLAIVQLTSWCMKRLPRRLWHAIHLLSLPLLVTGTVHGILAGADWSNRVVQWGLVVLCSVVVWLATFRVLAPRKDPATTDRLAAARAAAAAAKQAAATKPAAEAPPANSPPIAADRSIWAPPASEPEPSATSRS